VLQEAFLARALLAWLLLHMSITKGIGCVPMVNGTQLVRMITKTDFLRCLRTLAAA
jgi:CBS domain-containing protein